MTAVLTIQSWEQTERARNIAATGSASPPIYAPLRPDSPLVTLAGHDAQYGRGRRYGPIRGVILHTTEGDNFTSSMRYNARRPEQVSATYHVGQAGEIGQGVPEADRPWTTGRWNDETISVEINGRASYAADKWLSMPGQLDALTDLLVDICQRNQLPAVWLTPTEWAEGASRQSVPPFRAGTNRGIIDHDGANRAAIQLGGSPAQYSHHDVGPGLRALLIAEIVPEVARRLAVASLPPTPPPPEEDMSTAVIWSPEGYANTWLVGAGSVVHLTPELYGHYRRLGVPHITETHPQMLKSVLALSGLTTADLVPR